MRVEQNGKTLYHIQNMNITSDGTAYDMFLWCDHEPTLKEIVDAFIEDYGCDEDDPNVKEWGMSSDIYPVYAEEL